jgi:hypothetical protein
LPDITQHTLGKSISFFTFLMRGGKTAEELLPFLQSVVAKIEQEVKATVQNQACLETLAFLTGKLLDTTKTSAPEMVTNEQKEVTVLDAASQPSASPIDLDAIIDQATLTPVEPSTTPVANDIQPAVIPPSPLAVSNSPQAPIPPDAPAA